MNRKKEEKNNKDGYLDRDKSIGNIYERIKKEYNISKEELIKFYKIKQLFDEIKITPELIERLEKKEYSVPVSIFSKELSCLETIVKYLRENLGLSNKETAKVLNRSEKTIYQAYSSARKKYSEKFVIEFSEYYIPASILANRKLAVLESIVKYLFENFHLNYSQISRLLHRDPRTIWTVYQRARRKNAKK